MSMSPKHAATEMLWNGYFPRAGIVRSPKRAVLTGFASVRLSNFGWQLKKNPPLATGPSLGRKHRQASSIRGRIVCCNSHRQSRTISTPQVLVSPRCQLGIAHGRLDVAVTKVRLQGACVGPLVGQGIASAMAKHVHVHRERHLGDEAEKGKTMKDVVVVIGPGQIGQAIARRVAFGKRVLLADKRQENAAMFRSADTKLRGRLSDER